VIELSRSIEPYRAQLPHMKGSPLEASGRSIASFLLGCIVLAFVTFVCVQLRTRLGIVALLYLLTIVIISLQCRFFVTLLCSVLAFLGLDYFFTSPVFSLVVTRPEDIAALLTFSTTALIVSALGSKVRKSHWELARENTERKRAEKELQQKEVSLREAQSNLAHVSRLTTIGELTVSIAHEVNQPLTAIINNANACLALLPSETKHLDELREALLDIVTDADRASAVIARIRALVENVPPQKNRLNINETIEEVIVLTRGELSRNRVLLQTRLADDLPPIMGDRIHLQQVILNLFINAIEAMSGVSERPRELLVSSERVAAVSVPATAGEREEVRMLNQSHVLVSVADSGTGLNLNDLDQMFDAFYTTKPQGLGMGLSISRSIVKAHGGRLWAMTNVPKGALFQFTLPIGAE
jgi:C4-dicarboxylate-specific signal transduction histidine kinase